MGNRSQCQEIYIAQQSVSNNCLNQTKGNFRSGGSASTQVQDATHLQDFRAEIVWYNTNHFAASAGGRLRANQAFAREEATQICH